MSATYRNIFDSRLPHQLLNPSSNFSGAERSLLWTWGVQLASIRALAETCVRLAAVRTSSSGPSGSDTVVRPKRAPSSGNGHSGMAAPPRPKVVADIMTRDVISVTPDTHVREIAETLVRNRISAVPVLDGERRLVGIVSEGDLLRRVEIETERDRRWWTEMFRDASAAASDYIKAHGLKAKYVMTPRPVTATDDMSLDGVVRLLEKRRVKRLPVLRDGHVVGIVSRADLVKALASSKEEAAPANVPLDSAIANDLTARIRAMPVENKHIQVTVERGVVNLWGPVSSSAEREALHVAAENTPGVWSINDHLSRRPQHGSI